MDDDFNTPMAIAALQRLRSDVNKFVELGLSTEGRQLASAAFQSLGGVLGLFQLDNWQFNLTTSLQTGSLSTASTPPIVINEEIIEGKLVERNEARKQKNFKKADEIRQFLASHGIAIEDKPDGTCRWKR